MNPMRIHNTGWNVVKHIGWRLLLKAELKLMGSTVWIVDLLPRSDFFRIRRLTEQKLGQFLKVNFL
jgi:hypothetical protein